jgi:uncharacterized protein YndB with AHSA1/START domain
MDSVTGREASVVDEEAFTVTRSISIAASVEKVWRAITEPEQISRWFGRTVFDGARPGAQGTMAFEGHGAVPIRIEAIDAPRAVTYRWCNDNALDRPPTAFDEAHSTVFTFTLEIEGSGTRLTVVEAGFESTSAPLVNLESHRVGWNEELDKLIALFEVHA